MEIQRREDGARYKALTALLVDTHVQTMGERRNDGLVDGTWDTKAFGRHVGHDSRVPEEEAS